MINKSIIVCFLFMTIIGKSQVSLLKEINFVLSDELNTVPESNSNSDENVPSFAEEDSCCIDSSLVISELLEGNKKELLQDSVLSDVITPIFRSGNNYACLNPYKKSHLLDSTYTVFGWHPHWSRDAYKSYNYSLLSMISYFSYEVNEHTGFYKTVHDWHETALLDSAQKHQVKVLLTLSSFGHSKNHILLSNKVALRNLINTSITLIRDRKAHGLTIDFEGINEGDRDLLTNFIIDISTQLKSENSEFVLSVALPAMDYSNAYSITELNDYVDLFVIMGYEFHGSVSSVAGPIAPLANGTKWNSLNLQKTLDDYLAKGINVKKFILGLPYYGAEWETNDLKFPSTAKSFVKYYSYRQVKNITGKSLGGFDVASSSKYYTYSDADSRYRQIWFEDSLSLGVKYDWIKENGLAGVGIWALGFDHGHDELWKLLAQKFAYTEKEVIAFRKAKNKFNFRKILGVITRVIRNPKRILKRPRPFLSLFGALAGISFMGFFVILRYGHRFKRFVKLVIQGGLVSMFIIAVALMFVFFNYLGVKETLYLIGGFLIGLLIFLIVSRKHLVEKDLP